MCFYSLQTVIFHTNFNVNTQIYKSSLAVCSQKAGSQMSEPDGVQKVEHSKQFVRRGGIQKSQRTPSWFHRRENFQSNEVSCICLVLLTNSLSVKYSDDPNTVGIWIPNIWILNYLKFGLQMVWYSNGWSKAMSYVLDQPFEDQTST